jgi:hypothetical protein
MSIWQFLTVSGMCHVHKFFSEFFVLKDVCNILESGLTYILLNLIILTKLVEKVSGWPTNFSSSPLG